MKYTVWKLGMSTHHRTFNYPVYNGSCVPIFLLLLEHL